MKKNVIFWIGIVNPDHHDKYGDYDYFEYSKNTWKHFCKKFNCHFVEFDTPAEKDLFKFRVNWQKAIFCFDELERQGIEYDQIALVDSSCMYKWNAPNFFELTQRKFTAWRDLDNMRWINDSIVGYESFFDYKLDRTKYVNSGFIIFNELHKEFFQSFKQLYYDNIDTFCELQDNIVKKGTEQTPLNYWLQKNDVEIKTDLPIAFKLTHLHRKEMFNHNWQLNEGNTPHFIKYGYNWIFNGIPKDQRTKIMQSVWEMVRHLYKINVLDTVQNKEEYKNSTSRKFKQDLLDEPSLDNMEIIEFGCCHGDTSKILSMQCKYLWASDYLSDNIDKAYKTCIGQNNIRFEVRDVNNKWDYPIYPDVVYMDALHDIEGVEQCLDRLKIKWPKARVIMDDYGHPMNTIKPAIDKRITSSEIEIIRYLGEGVGFKAANGKEFVDREGVIFQWKK